MTNNSNEAHNRYINNSLKETHASPWTLTVYLVKEITMSEVTLKKLLDGKRKLVKQRYVDLNEKRKNIKKMWKDLHPLVYLKKMGNLKKKAEEIRKEKLVLVDDTENKKRKRKDKTQRKAHKRAMVEEAEDGHIIIIIGNLNLNFYLFRLFNFLTLYLHSSQ